MEKLLAVDAKAPPRSRIPVVDDAPAVAGMLGVALAWLHSRLTRPYSAIQYA